MRPITGTVPLDAVWGSGESRIRNCVRDSGHVIVGSSRIR
jgi:hypothetical protein